jgi:hypothetical protein
MTVETVKDLIKGRVNAGGRSRDEQRRNGDDTTVIEAQLEAWRDILTSIKEYELDEY